MAIDLYCPSTCARAVSVSGSQNVMSMTRYISMAARMLPGLLTAPRQTIDLAEPCNPVGNVPRARADTYADCLLQQRTPLREAPLEPSGIAQARYDPSQLVLVARGTTEG